MQYKLTEKHKIFLRWIVDKIRAGEIDEEFRLHWGSPFFISYSLNGIKKVKYDGELILKGFFDPLDKLEVLFSTPELDSNHNEEGRWFTTPPILFDLVDSDFNDIIIPNEVRNVIERIIEIVPNCDEVIIKYIEESLVCLQNGAKLATQIMIGGASEKAICLLLDSFFNNINNEDRKRKLKTKVRDFNISKKYQEFQNKFNAVSNLPESYKHNKNNIKSNIGKMFEYTKEVRNEIGHPVIIPDIDYEMLFTLFRFLPKYLSHIYCLIEHFEVEGVDFKDD